MIPEGAMYLLNATYWSETDTPLVTLKLACSGCGVDDQPLTSIANSSTYTFHGAALTFDGFQFCDPCFLRAKLEGSI